MADTTQDSSPTPIELAQTFSTISNAIIALKNAAVLSDANVATLNDVIAIVLKKFQDAVPAIVIDFSAQPSAEASTAS